MASYNKNRGWQHVYIVVPKFNGANLKTKGQYYTVDCVMDKFNAEKPFIDCYDRTILGGNNESGLNGFGSIIPFKGLSNKVYPNVFYSTGLGTWALKSLDGSFLIQGDPKVRYVGTSGVDCLDGLFATALKIGGKLVKGVVKKVGKKIVDKVKEKVVSAVTNVKEGAKEVASTAKEAVAEAKQTIQDTGQVYAQQFNDLKNVYAQQTGDLRDALQEIKQAMANGANPEELEKLIKKANNAAVMATDKTKTAAENAITNCKTATEDAIKKSNNATVISIDKISKEEKAHIDEKIKELEQPLKDIAKSAQSTEELQANVAKATALAAGGQKLTQDLQKSNKITMYILAGVAVLVVIMLFKRR